MSRVKSWNSWEIDGSSAVLLIRHKGDTHRIIVDRADVSMVDRHKWSIGRSRTGYLFVQTSEWIPGVGQRTVRLGRLILGAAPEVLVDHENRNIFDFRRTNLRLATRANNAQNRGPSRTSTTGIRGVTLEGGKYKARVQVNGKVYQLGRFRSASEARAAAVDFRRKHMPFSNEDVPDCPKADQFRKKVTT